MNYHTKNIRLSVALVLAFFLILPGMASAFSFGDICDNSRNGKAFFDLDTSKMDNHSLQMVLHGLKVTHGELEDQGVTPDFIIAFRGMNTGILSNEKATEEAKMMIAELKDMGVEIQICVKAILMSGENQDDVLSEISVIDNAWIASILSQNKRLGYAYITF